jgi:hypothetical protein
MNLQEDIYRIKQVMGINENRNHFFIRRQEEFLEDVLNSFDWMDVEESNSVEEYVEDILRHSIDSFFGYNNILVTSEEIAELLPLALKILRNNKEGLFKEMKGYWYRNNSTSRIDESNEMLLIKRRMSALLEYIEHSYDWLSPRRFNNFDDFLQRVVFSAARDFIADEIGGEYDKQLDIREKLEPQILEFIKRNEGLYNEIYDHYISNKG